MATFPSAEYVTPTELAPLDARVTALENAPPPPTGTSGKSPGVVSFDDYFQGTTDSEKFTNLNKWAAAHGGKPTPTCVFDSRVHTTTVPIGLASGLRLMGAAGLPTREFGRSTVIKYSGAGALFKFGVTQTNQSYPSDNSPRDIHVTGIEFRGSASLDFIEQHPPGTAYAGFVLWMSEFHNCGWNGWRSICYGLWDGTSVSGVSHVQAVADTAFWLGGSENSLFGNDAYSFMDSGILGAGKPFIRSSMAKSSIGEVMVTSRKDHYALLIEGGHSLNVHGFACDAQDSDPAYGCNIRVTGGSNIDIEGVSFKGHMANPASGPGGAALNQGVIHVEGGQDIIIQGNGFARRGSSLPPPGVPLVYTGAGVPTSGVRVGLNGHYGYDGVLKASRAGQIVSLDPTMRVSP